MNLNELKAKAQAATPGPWIEAWPYVVIRDPDDPHKPLPIAGEGFLAEGDCAFIAAANPETVLALVKVAEAVKKVLEADNQEFYPDSPFDRAVEDAYAALEELEAME